MKDQSKILQGLLIIVIFVPLVFLLTRFSTGEKEDKPDLAKNENVSRLADSSRVESSHQNNESAPKKVSEKTTSSKKIEKMIEPEFSDTFVQHEAPVDLTFDNNPELTNIIATNMEHVLPSPRGAVKYTVYIESLTSPKMKTYVSNWTPAKAQFSASVIKLYILITVFQQYQQGLLTPETLYELAEEDRVTGSGIMLYEPNGTVYTLEQLCNLMITESDNIATNVLIDVVGGFDVINQVIKEIEGNENYSSIERKMMDTSNIENGKANRVNARQVVQTMLKLYQGKIISPEIDQEMLNIMLETQSRKKLPGKLPKGAVAYNKTGESSYRGIENDLAIIEYQGEVFGICVLTQMDGDGETPQESKYEQSESQIEAISVIGKEVTQWIGNNGVGIAQ